MLSFTRSRKLLVALAAAGAAFGIASAVQAGIPDASGVVHACYNTSLAHGNPTGALRAVDTSTPGGNCASWEAPVTLASTQYVGQTSYVLPFQATIYGPGLYWGAFACADGFIAVDPYLRVQGTGYIANDNAITQNASGNRGASNTGTPDNVSNDYFTVSASATFPFTVGLGTTCVDGRVYGQAGPSSPSAPTGDARGSVTFQKAGS